jgi:hypothetical protein
VKRGFAGPLKNCSFEVNYLVLGGDQPIFLQGVLSTKYLQDLRQQGVDVMITIFCDFCQFSPKTLAFFSKSNGIKNLHNLALFLSKKTPKFSPIFFGENILKIITSVPAPACSF